MPHIKYGFLIEKGKIFDTKIKTYELRKKICGTNIIYYMEQASYKRLYLFEPLISLYPLDKLFEILNMNSFLRKDRKTEKLIKTNKLHYISNMATIYNYPPTYLTQKRFYLYKTIQSLLKRLE